MINVREARLEDAGIIVDFQVRMAKETEGIELDRTICSRGVDALFEDVTLGRYFVAEMDGVVVGSLMITYEWSDWRNGMVWWIQSVFVIPDARGAGVYTSLYEFVKNLVVTSESIRGIRLYVDLRNEVAQAVYRKLGMSGDHYKVFEWMR
jgi:GNAT superfamily N-acetyltransferase